MNQFNCVDAIWCSIDNNTRKVIVRENYDVFNLSKIIQMIAKALYKYETN